jgi:hypothetical protein
VIVYPAIGEVLAVFVSALALKVKAGTATGVEVPAATGAT